MLQYVVLSVDYNLSLIQGHPWYSWIACFLFWLFEMCSLHEILNQLKVKIANLEACNPLLFVGNSLIQPYLLDEILYQLEVKSLSERHLSSAHLFFIFVESGICKSMCSLV